MTDFAGTDKRRPSIFRLFSRLFNDTTSVFSENQKLYRLFKLKILYILQSDFAYCGRTKRSFLFPRSAFGSMFYLVNGKNDGAPGQQGYAANRKGRAG